MSLQRRTMLDTTTSMDPSAVLRAAQDFFARRNTIYAAFVEQQSATHLSMRGQGGEEIAIAVDSLNGATRVTGSSYMFDGQVSRFFATLPPVAADGAVV